MTILVPSTRRGGSRHRLDTPRKVLLSGGVFFSRKYLLKRRQDDLGRAACRVCQHPGSVSVPDGGALPLYCCQQPQESLVSLEATARGRGGTNRAVRTL